jgi:hypothetical protein
VALGVPTAGKSLKKLIFIYAGLDARSIALVWRKIMKQLGLGIIVAIGLTLPVAAQGVDPLIGTWKLNLAKSTSVGAELDKSQTLTYTRDGQNIVNNYETIDAKNQVFKGVLNHIYDGKPHSSTGSSDTNATAYTRMGNIISFVRSQNGKPVFVGQGIIDGNTYTVITGGINASNQPLYQVYVFDRQ